MPPSSNSSALVSVNVALLAASLAALVGAAGGYVAAKSKTKTKTKTKTTTTAASSSTSNDVSADALAVASAPMKKSQRRASPSYPLEAMAAAPTEKARFEALFPMLRDEILAQLKAEHELPKEALDWVEEVMNYTVPGGKLNRGITVVSVYQTLMEGDGQTASPTDLARASVLGWAVEFLQAFFLVADDVMDASVTRRGQPCWYRHEKVGLIAINDSFLLESFVFAILKAHFGNADPVMYHKLLDLFLTTVQQTECGQLLDLTSQPLDTKIVDLSRFTWERYRQIVQYKTAYYTFYLSVALGMVLSGVRHDRETFAAAQSICLQMGEYFQIQDDYLDCFGDPKHIGKIGTDIQDNKCSWLIVQALKRVDKDGRKLLEDNYGKWDDAKVAKVKELYRKLDLPKVFADYEEASYVKINKEIDAIADKLPRAAFDGLLNKIYKRSK